MKKFTSVYISVLSLALCVQSNNLKIECCISDIEWFLAFTYQTYRKKNN